MISIRGWLHVLFLLCSLIFLGVTHRGTIVGDRIFHAIGISPWSDPETNQGFHYSMIFGIVMVILSGKLTINHFRQRYKKYVGRTIMISCIIFFYSYPLLTEQVYYLLNGNKSGIEVVDLLKKDSRCVYSTQEDTVPILCNLRVTNYGRQTEKIWIRPIIHDYGDFKGIWSFVEVPHQEIALPPKSNKMYTIHFESMPDDRVRAFGAGGTSHTFGLEFVKDGQKKEIYTY